MNYEKRIKMKIILLYICIVSLIGYTVILSLYGAGDSRYLPAYALQFGGSGVFVCLIYMGIRIAHYSKLLNDRYMMQKAMLKEQDERRRYLHDKSGGTVWTCIFVFSLFITITCAEFDKTAFFASYMLFVGIILIKIGFYTFYRFIKK